MLSNVLLGFSSASLIAAIIAAQLGQNKIKSSSDPIKTSLTVSMVLAGLAVIINICLMLFGDDLPHMVKLGLLTLSLLLSVVVIIMMYVNNGKLQNNNPDATNLLTIAMFSTLGAVVFGGIVLVMDLLGGSKTEESQPLRPVVVLNPPYSDPRETRRQMAELQSRS